MAIIDDPVIVRAPAAQQELSNESGLLLRVPSADRVLELIAVFTTITGLIGLGCALAGIFHAPQVLLASLLLSGWYAYRTQGRDAFPGVTPRWVHLALLLAITLFFRLPAYQYVLGGQDEGLYVNIAHHIERTGAVAVHDDVKRQLLQTPFLQRYVEDNQVTPDSYLAGIYSRDYKNGKVEFQFYHLFPVWMALSSGTFGPHAGVYALTFLSLLSVLFFYRLTLLLTNSRSAALLAGGLLALNPLHAFFSKFPVTEVPTLAFSLIGFTCLVAAWSSKTAERQSRWMWLSALAFLCLFTTRISGFMYVPFFVAIAMAALVFDSNTSRRTAIQHWAIMVIALYFLSVIYGLIWSHSYSHDIYVKSFEPIFGNLWKFFVAAISIVGVGLWAALAMLLGDSDRRAKLALKMGRPLSRLPGLLVFTALLLGLLKIYWLGWTQHYASDSWLVFWHLSGAGWKAAAATSIATLIVYLGPLLLLAFLALVSRRQTDPRLEFLRWFVSGFFVYALLLQWTVPYGPYYARYMLSELVPYLILLVVCVWAGLRVGGARAALTAALFLSMVYAAGLSAAQLGKSEDDGANEALTRLTRPVESDDLILLDTAGLDTSVIKTPLLYTFGKRVVTVGNAALRDPGYIAELSSMYDDLFLISADPTPPPGYTMLDSVRFKVMAFQRTHMFPRDLVPTQNIVLYLYRLGHPQLMLGKVEHFLPGMPWMAWFSTGWYSPEDWGVWSKGKLARLNIDARQLPDINGLVLQLDANVFVTPSHPQQRVKVSVDGQLVAEYRVVYPATTLTMNIPIDQTQIESGQRIPIDFALPDAISPEAVGAGADTRVVALGLVSLRIEAPPQAFTGPSPAKAPIAAPNPRRAYSN